MEMFIYTDGAAKGNQSANAIGGWGFVILDSDKKIVMTRSGGNKNTTNNKMELTAIYQALLQLKKEKICKNVTIYSDSAYCVNGLNEWIFNWIRKGWKTSTGKQVKNIELWKGIKENLDNLDMNIKFIKVKGHSGDKFNDLADRLANEGVGKVDL